MDRNFHSQHLKDAFNPLCGSNELSGLVHWTVVSHALNYIFAEAQDPAFQKS